MLFSDRVDRRLKLGLGVLAMVLLAGLALQVSLFLEVRSLKRDVAEIRMSLPPFGRSRGPAAPPPIPTEPVSLAGAQTKGDANAKVAVIEYTDFQCPYCASFVNSGFRQLDDAYISTGKILFAFRNLPLTNLHPDALKAAEAGQCAARQGKFWEMHDLLFEAPHNLKEPSLLERARKLRLDIAAFETCLKGSGTVPVRQEMSAARALRITGTPTFLIGTLQADGNVKVTHRMSGFQSFAAFQDVLEPLLAGTASR